MHTLALINIPQHLGLLILFALIAVESSGIPVPGETALIAASILASQGRFAIELVVPIAAAAAIIGDNVGFVIGRTGGRRLLEAPGPLQGHRLTVLREGGAFFEKHGAKAVLFGRWVAGLRIAAAWMAGITKMPWREFLLWNALGGISWAVSVGLIAYFVGDSAEAVFQAVGFVGIGVAALALLGFAYWRRHRDAPAA